MFSVTRGDLPEEALLSAYSESGAFADCYFTEIDRVVSQAEYVQAFYSTPLFKLERAILKWAVSRPSTDDQARRLSEGETDTFAAWNVEARNENQLLLSDFRQRTRSWLMSEASPDGRNATRLYFGSAVVPPGNREPGEPRMGMTFSLLLQFHKLYSQALLASARSRLSR